MCATQQGFCNKPEKFEHHLNIVRDDGAYVQVPKTQVTCLGKGYYRIHPDAKVHVFPQEPTDF